MDGRVLIDVGGNPLAASPTWARFDELTACRCPGFDITTGRQSEFDITETGEATVYFNDRNGTMMDPDLVGSPIQLQVRDPTSGVWEVQWRGTIDDVDTQPHPFAEMANTRLKCKDVFDYLAQTQMIVGLFGQATSTGSVLYEDQRVDERLQDLCDDAGLSWSGAGQRAVIFTGNVNVWDTFYDSGDPVLIAMRDACDAEFAGGIANIYVDRYGRLVFHGREARFDPDGTATAQANWDFNRWDAATREDVTTGQAAIREFSFNVPRTRIVNAAIAWPRYDANGKYFPESDKAAQVRSDATSIARYGYRAMPPMGDLIIKNNFNNSNTGAVECGLMADFWVNNYKVPRTNIQRVTFRSTAPSHPVASETWALMLQSDISDIIALTVDEAGLAAADFYIEGFDKQVRSLNPDYDDVTVTPNLTPFSYYADGFPTAGT